MKISLSWLSEFIDWRETDAQAISDRLTLASAETEDMDVQGALLEHCCVGKVLSIAKHPNADKLLIAEVETDKGTKRVVCGGTNLSEGMLVAFAHVGATVKWHGGELMTLAPVKIRGEQSEGMICAAEELGLESMYHPAKEDGERPIVDASRFGVELKVGQGLREALGLSDTVLDFSNSAITNRPDLFSHLGFARECVAAGLATWKKGQPKVPKVTFPKNDLPFNVRTVHEDLVPRYAAACLSVEGHGVTPEWMVSRLRAVGIRSINLPVDITNYVMLETGVPMHAFDLSTLQGKELLFREAKEGEKVTTLDHVERTLSKGTIVLEDAAGIFDLCGLMGDARSAVTDATHHFYIHAPSFSSMHVRKAIQHTGLRSDASTIFEKGVPPVMVEHAMHLALSLFVEHCPGAKLTSKLLSWGDDGTAKPITVSLARLHSLLGVDLSVKDITAILTSLECTVTTKKTAKDTTLTVTPPLFRRDLLIPADIVDEVARIYGYDRIPEVMPTAEVRIPVRDKRTNQLRDSLKGDGFLEIVPLSLLGPQLLEQSGMDTTHAVRIANPLSEDLSLMQTSTLPALLAHAQKNLLLSNGTLKTFHWGHVFSEKTPEHTEFSALYAAKEETSLTNDPFLTLKGTLTAALWSAGYDITFAETKEHAPYMHPGRCAEVRIGGQIVGTVFELHPSVRQRFDLSHRAAACMIDLSKLLAIPAATRIPGAMSHFPAITYDVTLPWSHGKTVGTLLTQLKEKSELLEAVDIADLYQGKQHQGDAYNLTLRFTYRAVDRTLTEDEAKKEHEKLLAGIA